MQACDYSRLEAYLETSKSVEIVPIEVCPMTYQGCLLHEAFDCPGIGGDGSAGIGETGATGDVT